MIEHIARPEKTTRPRKCQVQLVDVFGCGRTVRQPVRSKEKMRARYTLELCIQLSTTSFFFPVPLPGKKLLFSYKSDHVLSGRVDNVEGWTMNVSPIDIQFF